ncbi:MAG: PEGA domain-containing protein [Nitrospiraceae bacterium]
MIKPTVRFLLVVCASLTLIACGQKLDLEVKARIDGQAAPQAKVVVDGQEQGTTDGEGRFAKTITKKVGAEVEVRVSKEAPGYRIQPWKTTFVVKLPKGGEVDSYSFGADLQATRYLTLVATEKGAPVADAVVSVNGKGAGKTDAKGEFVYDYQGLPKKGVEFAVSKPGYAAWRKTSRLEPGGRLDAALSRRAVVSLVALTEEYGQSSGLAGLTVSLDGKPVGKTDERGAYTYTHDGEPGKKVQVSLSAPGYIPIEWKTSVTLGGQVTIQRYFYPTTAKPIRVGIYRFAGNTPGVDLKEVVAQTEEAIAVQLFKYPAFREVPREAVRAEIEGAKLGIDRLTTKAWNDTPLRRTVDMIVVGSVAQDDAGFTIEARFYTSGGKVILSQITRARTARDILGAAKEIAANVIDHFPFEGRVVAVEDDRYWVNIGKPYRMSRGTDLTLSAPRLGDGGRVTGYRETGRLRVRRADEDGAWAEVEDLKKGEKVTIGDRVARRLYEEGEQERQRDSFILSTKGGVAGDSSTAPLPGVNVYLNNEWVGTTGVDGRAEVPLRLGRSYHLVLYRHGYQPVSEKITVEKNREVKEFALGANNSLFKVDSLPSGAAVSVDADDIGKTPLLEGKLVNLGFHRVRLSVGEDYRDWEEVMEFDKKVEDRTGDRKIVLHKDYLRIGEKAAQRGDLDAAIQAYASTVKGHPDYSEAHRRLGELYLDERNDYDSAIHEFENVLSLPENQQLIYKQFAVTFTNLGHAYYEKGNNLVQKDPAAAAQYFGKAVQNLQIAKQNTRFFPTQEYHEALHDTYYYLALSHHKLYLVTRRPAMMNNADLAWREYFDFFPKKLEGNPAFAESHKAARRYWAQIKDQQ